MIEYSAEIASAFDNGQYWEIECPRCGNLTSSNSFDCPETIKCCGEEFEVEEDN
jgi:hypothetical protein